MAFDYSDILHICSEVLTAGTIDAMVALTNG
jgi:hypothetical protein